MFNFQKIQKNLNLKLIFLSNLFSLWLTIQQLITKVVKQYYEIQVYDVFVMKGNTAIFKCQIPSFVSDHVDIVEWVSTENDTYRIGDDELG